MIFVFIMIITTVFDSSERETTMEEAQVIEFSGESEFDLELCFAGTSQCAPLHSYGPAVRPNYLIHIVFRGHGTFRQDAVSFSLEAGQGFLIEPDQVTFYQADQEDPWEYGWVGFRGSRATDLMKQLDLGADHPVFSCSGTQKLRDLILEMMNIQGSHLSERLHREALLTEFFSVLAAELHVDSSRQELTCSDYIRQAISFIQDNYDQPIRVSDIAAHIGIDRTYLYMLFVEHLDTTPKDYLKAYRLTRAKELLKVTDLPIKSIAESCGYGDPLVFSKAFRQAFEMTPTSWRKTRKQGRPPKTA